MIPGHENNAVIAPILLANVQNVVEPGFGLTEAYKATTRFPSPAAQEASLSMQMQLNMFTPIGSQTLPNSDVENMVSQQQSQSLLDRSSTLDCAVANNSLNEQEDLTIDSGSISISSAYSQGILNNLTQALQFSGVDLSQASISVQIDVGKGSSSASTTMTSGSRDDKNPSPNFPRMATGIGNFGNDPKEANKKRKPGN